jgi:hypothetical protein
MIAGKERFLVQRIAVSRIVSKDRRSNVNGFSEVNFGD